MVGGGAQVGWWTARWRGLGNRVLKPQNGVRRGLEKPQNGVGLGQLGAKCGGNDGFLRAYFWPFFNRFSGLAGFVCNILFFSQLAILHEAVQGAAELAVEAHFMKIHEGGVLLTGGL